MREYAPVLIMSIAVSYGIFSNKPDLKELRLELKADNRDLRADLNARFDRMESKQDRMQADLAEFHRSLSQHDKAIEVLEKRK